MSLLKLMLITTALFALSACAEKHVSSESPSGGDVRSSAEKGDDAAGAPMEEIAVSASSGPRKSKRLARISSDSDTPKIPVISSPEPQTEIQSGTITGADYDDQLNSQLYLDYASKFLQNNKNTNLPFLDLSQRITLTIHDSNNKPIQGLTVKVLSGDDTIKVLNTPKNGEILLYPRYDKLPESFKVNVLDRKSRTLFSKTFSLKNLKDNALKTITLDKPFSTNKTLDLALVIDTTGSMGDELAYLKKELRAIANNINNANPNLDVNVGLVVYRDAGDSYVTSQFDFTNTDDLVKTLLEQSYGGGGDYPEAMDQALVSANSLSWRKNSTKVMLLVADAPPHDDKVQATWEQAEIARSKQIHIVPVAASGVGDKAQYLMRAMAALTQSRYLFLTDDSGVGNPHAEPSVDCYVVSRLDNLITRVINGLILGQRIEANDDDIIRRKGNYQNGVCTTLEQTPSLPK